MSTPATPLGPDGLPLGQTLRPQWEVSPRQVRDGLANPPERRPLLVDCRRAEEREFNRIEGSVFIPMSEIESRLDELEGESGGREADIVIYCHHGARSLKVALALQAHGFTGARSMAGGIDLWSLDIDPDVPRY